VQELPGDDSSSWNRTGGESVLLLFGGWRGNVGVCGR
jgi:hypothetical protein